MSRIRGLLRPRVHPAGRADVTQGEHHGQVPVAQALPRRAGARQRCPDGPVEARRGRGTRPVHERLRSSAREQRRVHRRTGAVPRRPGGPLRRRGGAGGERRAGRPHVPVDDVELRELVPRVLSVLVCRGADFATAEDAVQEALIRALSAWGDELPAEPAGWLITVAWRAFLDMTRSDAARRDRELRFDTEPPAGAIPRADDTLRLYFLCAHPDLTSSSAVALTLRAVGGLTTRQIAQAYLVPERTMAQRISRAKRTVSRAGVDRPGDVRTVMRMLYLVFNEGYSGDVDLAAEAIRLTRQLAAFVDDPEVGGLLALMLLHHARRRSRTRPDGR